MIVPQDPLDFIDMDDVHAHGDPSQWIFKGPKSGSPTSATSPHALPGTKKHYDLYINVDGEMIEVHYFRYSDGTVGNVKIK